MIRDDPIKMQHFQKIAVFFNISFFCGIFQKTGFLNKNRIFRTGSGTYELQGWAKIKSLFDLI